MAELTGDGGVGRMRHKHRALRCSSSVRNRQMRTRALRSSEVPPPRGEQQRQPLLTSKTAVVRASATRAGSESPNSMDAVGMALIQRQRLSEDDIQRGMVYSARWLRDDDRLVSRPRARTPGSVSAAFTARLLLVSHPSATQAYAARYGSASSQVSVENLASLSSAASCVSLRRPTSALSISRRSRAAAADLQRAWREAWRRDRGPAARRRSLSRLTGSG